MEDSIQIWGGFFQYKKENISSTLNLEMIQNNEIIKLFFRINISIKSLIALFILLHSQVRCTLLISKKQGRSDQYPHTVRETRPLVPDDKENNRPLLNKQCHIVRIWIIVGINYNEDDECPRVLTPADLMIDQNLAGIRACPWKKVRAGTPKKVKVQTKEPLSDWMCMAYGPKIVKLFTFEIIYVVSST